MIGYIYHIINVINGKMYVGKTFDIKHRFETHMSDLKLNKHHSQKLQRAVNKYGIENFKFSYEQRNIDSEEELALLEIQEIEKYDSYQNGYNETLGREGHKTVFSFEQSTLLYQVLQRYKGINRLIAKYYDCDHTVVDQLAKNDLYSNVEYDEAQLEKLIQELNLSEDNLKENYIQHNKKKLTQETCLELLSVIMQKKGYDKTMCEIFGIDPKVTYRLKRGLIYKDFYLEYINMSEQEQKKLLDATLKKYSVEAVKQKRTYSSKRSSNSLTQEQVNYILENKENKSQAQISRDLNISADRVRGIIKGLYYPDLIKNYYSSIK